MKSESHAAGMESLYLFGHLSRLPLVRRAMYDNGCTVKLLPGSQVGMVQVLGDHEISIRRCMKQVMKMVSPIHIRDWGVDC